MMSEGCLCIGLERVWNDGQRTDVAWTVVAREDGVELNRVRINHSRYDGLAGAWRSGRLVVVPFGPWGTQLSMPWIVLEAVDVSFHREEDLGLYSLLEVSKKLPYVCC